MFFLSFYNYKISTLCCFVYFYILSLKNNREWIEVEERFKVQELKCAAILSFGMDKVNLMNDKRCLVSLFHSDMLSLTILDTLSKDSLELKSLEKRSSSLIEYILLAIGKEITVCIKFILGILQKVYQNKN